MTKMTPSTVPAVTTRLATASVALLLVGALAACGGSADESTAGRTLVVTVQGKKVTPAPSTVDLAVGKTLTLVVTSDHDDELHIHGFEVESTLKAGKATSVTLTGKEPGVYEVETHHPALRLLKIAVR